MLEIIKAICFLAIYICIGVLLETFILLLRKNIIPYVKNKLSIVNVEKDNKIYDLIYKYVYDCVKKAEQTIKTDGYDKYQDVMNNVKEFAKNNGYYISDDIIDTLIESVVNTLYPHIDEEISKKIEED